MSLNQPALKKFIAKLDKNNKKALVFNITLTIQIYLDIIPLYITGYINKRMFYFI